MHLRGVLPQARSDHVLGFFNRDTVDVVDLFPDHVIGSAVGLPRQREIVIGKIEAVWDRQIRMAQSLPPNRGSPFQARAHPSFVCAPSPSARNDMTTSGRAWLKPLGMHPNHARFAVGILLQPNHFGRGAQRVTFKNRLEELPLGVAQIGQSAFSETSGTVLPKTTVWKRAQIVKSGEARQATMLARKHHPTNASA